MSIPLLPDFVWPHLDFLVISGLMARELKPKFKEKRDLIKGTYSYENGSIRQEGTEKDGKMHGEWVSFDQNGKKNAVAQYREGVKMGKWVFLSTDGLTEVQYDTNKIVNIKEHKTRRAG